MPAIVGAIQIINVGPSSVVHIGDAFQLSPFSQSKTFAGAGSFNTGRQVATQSSLNNTNTQDSDLLDNVTVTPTAAIGRVF